MRRFSQIDVFADELGLGNALAVVHEADGLDDEAMARFARWTQLSETTFLLAPRHPEADYRVRIFTPTEELPFAGHPTLGSARAHLEAGGVPHEPGAVVQECGVGLVRIRMDGTRLSFAAPPLRRAGALERKELERLARVLGITPARVRAAAWADNGPGWKALLLDSAQTVLGIETAGLGLDDRIGVIGPYEGGEADFEVRAFAPGAGVHEDPVTGSLNAALGQWLIPEGLAPASYVVSQGTRLHRRGRIQVHWVDGEVWVGGNTVVGITGSVAL